jgi:hypothetical protein
MRPQRRSFEDLELGVHIVDLIVATRRAVQEICTLLSKGTWLYADSLILPSWHHEGIGTDGRSLGRLRAPWKNHSVPMLF